MSTPALHQRPETWNDCAQDYEDCFVPVSSAAARAGLEGLGLRTGERFLDVAAGTGAVSIEAARLGASVLAIDFAAEMLALLDRKLETLEVSGVETRVMDAQALDLPDRGFDAAGSNLGLIFCADPARAIAELHRVLHHGGRAFVSAARPEGSRLMELIARALMSAAPNLPPRPDGAALELADPTVLAEHMRDAGFRGVRVETTRVAFPLVDPASFWQRWALTAPPVRAATSSIPASVRDAAQNEFVRLVAEHGPASLSMDVHVGFGRR